MRKSACLMFIFIFLTASCTVLPESSSDERIENSWTTKSSMPQATSGVKAAVMNGKIYVMGGAYNYEYDPATDSWTAKKSMPTPRIGSFSIATCQNKIYVIGGEDEVLSSRGYYILSINEVYDPSMDTWETKEPMPTNRTYIEANVVNGKIYVLGGITYEDEDNQRQKYTAVNEVYDPARDSWTTRQSSPIAVARHASTVVDHKIYIMGGTDSSQQWKSNQIYDVENDSWSLGASLPSNTYYATAVATTGVMAPERIYVFGGGLTEPTGSVHVYDPVLDNWTLGTSMPTNRTGLAAGIVNDVIYAMGGNLGWEGGEWPLYGHPLGTTNVVEQYTPFGYGTILPESEPFPITLVAATIATVTTISIGLLVYLKNRHGGRNKRN